jgi:hypothetical protein
MLYADWYSKYEQLVTKQFLWVTKQKDWGRFKVQINISFHEDNSWTVVQCVQLYINKQLQLPACWTQLSCTTDNCGYEHSDISLSLSRWDNWFQFCVSIFFDIFSSACFSIRIVCEMWFHWKVWEKFVSKKFPGTQFQAQQACIKFFKKKSFLSGHFWTRNL